MRIWDYQLVKPKKNTPEFERWILERKLNYGNFKKIKLETLKKYLPYLKIDPIMRLMLNNFLKIYA